MSIWMFAYGSNMCLGHLHSYKVFPESPGRPAVLRDYCLKFNKRSTKDCSGKANIEPFVGSEVWGVLYSIPDAHLDNLIKGEGPGYAPETKRVEVGDGSTVDAKTFIAVTLRPYSWYKRFLVEGARKHRLPAAYIASLEAMEAVEDPDPERDRKEREINCE
jgi:cation transport regulator ChaC